jgi:hypothetical protein
VQTFNIFNIGISAMGCRLLTPAIGWFFNICNRLQTFNTWNRVIFKVIFQQLQQGYISTTAIVCSILTTDSGVALVDKQVLQ